MQNTEQPTTTDSKQETTAQPSETTTNQETTTESNREETTTNQQTTTDSNQETTTESNREETTTDSGRDTTTQPTEEPATTTARPQSNGNSSCPPVEEGQAHYVCPTGFRRHPKDCGMFYQCTESPETSHLSIVTFNCPNGTVYDEDAIQCRDRTRDDNCPSSSQNSTLLRGTLFDIDLDNSPIVSDRSNLIKHSN